MPIDDEIDLPINAEPTKQFFVDMITRDIQLEQAVLDQVDNSVDGARRFRGEGEKPLDKYEIRIKADANGFPFGTTAAASIKRLHEITRSGLDARKAVGVTE